MLQAQKLLKVEVEEEPKGEAIVGSSGEALRPPGMHTAFAQKIFFLWVGLFGQQPP